MRQISLLVQIVILISPTYMFFFFFKRKADVAKTKTTVKGSADLIANRETNWTKQAAGYAAAQPDALLPRSAPPPRNVEETMIFYSPIKVQY